MLARLIAALFDLCLLKRGPQDLPFRPVLVLALLLAGLALEVYGVVLVGVSNSAEVVLLSGVFAVAAPWALLRWRGLDARLWQTLLALIGTGVLFSLLRLPLLAALGPLAAQPKPALAPLYGWGLVLLIGWQLLVYGHIWRHALRLPLPTGVLVALGLWLTEMLLQGGLLRALGGAAATP